MSAKPWICAVLALVTVAAFAEIRHAEFLSYDDDGYVTANEYVRQGLTIDGLIWAATTDRLSNWQPITWLSHMLDVQLFGMNAGAHHLVNLGIHGLNSVLLFLLFATLTGTTWRSALVAGLFALHPLHVESVAWVSERKDVLSTLFWLGAVFAHARYARGGSWWAYGASLLMLALGLMTKPMLVTLPFVLLLFDVWPLRRIPPQQVLSAAAWRPLLVEKLPGFALALGVSLISMGAQRGSGTMWTLEMLPLSGRVENALVSYARYLGKTCWPGDLSIFYPHPLDWETSAVLGAALLLLAITIACLALWRRAPYAAVGWLFFLGTLVPTIGLVQVGNQAMADRYTYVALLGPFWTLAWGCADLAARLRGARGVLAGCAALMLGACAYTTYRYVPHWHDTLSIFQHALASTRDNATAHNTVGLAYYRRGEYEQALQHYDEAVRIQPNYGLAHYNHGDLLLTTGELDAAIKSLSRAVELRPNRPRMRFRLGFAYERSGDPERAEALYRSSLESLPGDPEIENRLGAVLGQQQRFDEAIAQLRKVLAAEPGMVRAHSNLGYFLDLAGREREAIPHYRATLASFPDALRALRGMAWIRAAHPDAELRDGVEALALAEQALGLRGGAADASDWDLLAAALAEAGSFEAALQAGERALRLAQLSADGEPARLADRVALYREGRPYHDRSP
jgi:tetratricopeptide (TPR) repeat protein